MKRLFIRLSSLGDIILCASALEVDGLGTSDWLVAQEFRELLEGHPRVNRLWVFDRRSSGFKDWVRLTKELYQQGYDEVVDLHNSLRSRVLRFLFWFWSFPRPPRIRVVSKQRFRLFGYFLAKKFWPVSWRPEPWVVRAARAVQGTGHERPSFNHLVKRGESALKQLREELSGHPYFCVMPSSLWRQKCYPVESMAQVLRQHGGLPVILGTKRDFQSLQLAECLRQSGHRFYSGVGRWSLAEVAAVLSGAEFLLSNDTGMVHLAEAVGTRVEVIYGPTTADMGFGPWRTESNFHSLDLICRPCSKDGRGCVRPIRRRFCLTALSPEQIATRLKKQGLQKQSLQK